MVRQREAGCEQFLDGMSGVIEGAGKQIARERYHGYNRKVRKIVRGSRHVR